MFGDWLRPLMTARDLTQEDLAARVGVRQQTVSKWLRNLSVPHARNVFAIATALQVTPEAVLNELSATLEAHPRLPEEEGPPPAEDEAELRRRLAQVEEEVFRQERRDGEKGS